MLFFFPCLVLANSEITKFGYQCAPSGLSDSKCSLQVNDIFYLAPCLHGYRCDEHSGTCTFPKNPYHSNAFAYVNEPCTYSIDCRLSTCVDGYCVGRDANAECTENLECNKNLFCSPERRCTPQSTVNEECMSDQECRNGLGCNITSFDTNTGRCIPYFSIQPGNPVAECEKNWTSTLLCSSGYCSTTGGRAGLCAQPVATEGSLPKQCTSNQDCQSQGFEGNCIGGYSVKPTAYCTLMPGDNPAAALRQELKEWYQSPLAENCNTARRHSLDCIKLWWDKYSYALLAFLSLLNAQYPLIQGNDMCTRQIMTPAYWEARANYIDILYEQSELTG